MSPTRSSTRSSSSIGSSSLPSLARSPASTSDYLGNCPPLPPHSATRNQTQRSHSPTRNTQTQRGVRETGTPEAARTRDSFTLIKSLQCQVFTLKSQLETFTSSEALVIGEQKILIRQLQAAEPFRVKDLTEQLTCLKRNFVSLLVEQIKRVSEIQLGINKVRMNGGDSAGSKAMMLDGERSKIEDYESEIQMCHGNIFMLRMMLERRSNALMDEVNKLLNGVSPDEEGHSEATSIGKCEQREEDDRDTGNAQESPTYYDVDEEQGSNDDAFFKDAVDDSCKVLSFGVCDEHTKNIDSRDEEDTPYAIPFSCDDRGDDSEDTQEQLEALQEQVAALQKGKDAEIGDLRCIIALQNKYYNSRIIEMQMKIEELHFQQMRKGGVNSTRIDALEEENKRIRESVDFLSRIDESPKNSMYSPMTVKQALSTDETVCHGNLAKAGGHVESLASVSEDSTETETIGSQETDSSQCTNNCDEQKTKQALKNTDETVWHDNLAKAGGHVESLASVSEDSTEAETIGSQETDSSQCTNNCDKQKMNLTEITATGISHESDPDATQGGGQEKAERTQFTAMELLLAAKDSQITSLENELNRAKGILGDVASVLNAYGDNDECRPLIDGLSRPRVSRIEEDYQQSNRKTNSWLMKKVKVIKRKPKKNKKPAADDTYNLLLDQRI